MTNDPDPATRGRVGVYTRPDRKRLLYVGVAVAIAVVIAVVIALAT